MKVAVTGATGFIGRQLVAKLTARGDEIIATGRRPLSFAEIDAADAVVNLAGEPVAQRWTAAAKRRIRDSRVAGTGYLAVALARSANPARVFVSASAIGFYGNRGDEVLTERSPAGAGFLAEVTRAWEEATAPASAAGVRVVMPRIGLVLGAHGGVLNKMAPPFRLGVGGRFGSGEQWMSWIHVDDVLGLLLHALDCREVTGPMNATAPEPIVNADFTKILGAVLHRPTIFPLPRFALRLMLGEMGDELVSSQHVIPEVARASGYRFQFTDLRTALEEALA